MGQIQIHDRKPFDRYIRKDYPQTLPRGLSSTPRETDPSALKVLFRESAVRDIWSSIDWGMSTSRNRTEQGGALVGNFCDAAPEGSASREVWVEVVHAIPCQQPETSQSEFLVMSAENWLEMENIRCRNNLRDGTDYVLVGWYHTHPGTLPTGFSGTDYNTHSAQFPFDYSIGAVFNPHRQIWSVFYGPSCRAGAGYLCLGESEAPSGTQPPSASQQPLQPAGIPGAEPTPHLECRWYRLVLENAFPFGPPRLTAQPDLSLNSIQINKPICDACGALAGLLRLDAALHTIVATAELRLSNHGVRFRMNSCNFYYDTLTLPESRFRHDAVGVILVGDPAEAGQNLKMIYDLVKRHYGWLAICDTRELEHYRHGQIKLYCI